MPLLRFATRQLIALVLFVSSASALRAQITNVTSDQAAPIPGVGHDYVKMINETVNPATGSVSIRINVPVPAGRGITVPFSFGYDSNSARHPVGPNGFTDNASYLGKGGWSYVFPYMNFQSGQLVWQPGIGGTPYQCNYYIDFVLQDVNGTTHSLGLDMFQPPTPPPGGCTYPGGSPHTDKLSGGDPWVQAVTPGWPGFGFPGLTAADQSGMVYYFSGANVHSITGGWTAIPDWIETTNGNRVTFTSANGGVFSMVDSVGRTALSSSGFGTSGNTVSVSGLSPYIVTWGTAPYNWTYQSQVNQDPGNSGTCVALPGHITGSAPTITSIKLPSGKSYTFEYSDGTSGLLNKIWYPTGGYIRYVWTTHSLSDSMDYYLNSSGISFSCHQLYDTVGLLDRYVSFDGVTEPLHQHFTYGTTWVPGNLSPAYKYWSNKSTTVTTYLNGQLNDTTTYQYLPADIPANPYAMGHYITTSQGLAWGPQLDAVTPVESSVTHANANGTVLLTSTKAWYNLYQQLCELTTSDNNFASFTSGDFYGYGPGGVMTDKKEYDFGQITTASACQSSASAPPSPYRETVITPQTFGVTQIYPNAVSILDRPASVKTYGSGALVSEIDYSYDQSAVSTVNNLALGTHDETYYSSTSSTLRGNATTVTRNCLQGCANAVTTYMFDETGQVVSKKDACGNVACPDMIGSNHTTTYSYTNNFDSNPSYNANAYLYQNTDPLGHVSTFKYAFSDGQLISSTDSNNNLTTSYSYDPDPLRRLIRTDFPDGGYVKTCYTDVGGDICSQSSPPYQVVTRKAINSTQYVENHSVLDGVGHTTQTQLTDLQGTIFTDISYDGLGRVRTQSNPYRTGVDPSTSSGTTTNYYDAIGRPCLVVPPDGTLPTGAACPSSPPANTIFTTYSGNATTVTDQTGRSRKSLKDALGRVTKIFEDPSGLAYETDYSYDALGNLMCAGQKGNNSGSFTNCAAIPASWRPRLFTYDSFSRMLTSTNPEAGTITYTYDANSNVSTKKDARNITITYGYDADNRNKSITYSNGDPSVSINYDESNCLGFSPCQNIGHRTSMTDAAGSEAWSYKVGSGSSAHVDQRTTIGTSGNYTKTSTYYLDLAGNTTQIVYPSGRTINYFYDNANRPSRATDAVNGLTYATGFQTPPSNTGCVATAVCYTPQGTPYALSIGQSSSPVFTGLNVTETFNSRLQPNEIKASSTGGNAFDITYSYADPSNGKNAGHIFAIANNLDTARSQTFGYDQLNRIISAHASTYATSPTKCWGETYSLDAWANLNSITPDPAFTGCSQEAGFSFTADGSNRLSAFLYDVAGNTTRDTVYTYNWNAESQLIYANAGANYAYDGDGRRVSKLNSNEPKLYWYGAGGEILTETSPTSLEITDYVYFGGKRVAQVANDFNLNGGFEAGLQGWSVSGSGTATAITNAANAHSGSQYADITSPANQTTTLTSTQPISAQTGETVSMTGWAYLESGSFGYVRWWVAVNGNSGQCALSGSGSNVTILNTWVYQTGSVTIPAWCQGPYTVTVSAQIQSGSQAVSARFDDATLNGNTLLFAEDSLGTTRVVTDTSGVVCYDADFYPYGGERPYANTCTTRYKFEGKERDAESGNDDFGARYYSNRFGRWLSSDWSATPVAVPYANLTNPQTLNLYSMVHDDPESFADLDGHQCLPCERVIESPEGQELIEHAIGIGVAGVTAAAGLAKGGFDKVVDMLQTASDHGMRGGVGPYTGPSFNVYKQAQQDKAAVQAAQKQQSESTPAQPPNQQQPPEQRDRYVNPGHHDTNSPNYVSGKTPLPKDAESTFGKAIKDTNRASGTSTTYYGKTADGKYYRYQGQNGEVHWNGEVSANKVPKNIRKQFDAQQQQ